MSKITTNNKQMNFLDLLKFILALMIVAIHVHPFGTGTSLSTNINNADFWLTDCLARIAVPFYFVCSGYFVFRKINLEDFDKRVPLNAAVRFLRLYLIWTIIYLPLITKQVVNNENGILYGVVLEIRNILFVGSYIQLWYLNALAVAIVLVTILLQKK